MRTCFKIDERNDSIIKDKLVFKNDAENLIMRIEEAYAKNRKF